MRKVFLDDLPHGGKNISSKRINWNKSLGHKVKFIYDNIEGEFEIVNYDANKRILTVKYKDNINTIGINNVRQSHIGYIINIKSKSYKYRTGDIVNDCRCGKLKILEQTRINTCQNRSVKGYNYICLICKNKGSITESNLIQKNGCSVCGHSKVIKGYNDLWTTHPQTAMLLKDRNLGYNISKGHRNKITFVCPDCKQDVNNYLSSINRFGLSCPKCSDKRPYGEKFMFAVLNQLNLKFEYCKYFDWSANYLHDNPKIRGRKVYDFYIPTLNTIIEIHGSQHYKREFEKISKNARTLEEEKENDKIKEKLAKDNSIDKYIKIDARKSELNWIKNNILNNNLTNIFNLSDIDWLACHKFACNSLVIKACELYKNNTTLEKISNILKIHKKTIRKYLKQGTELKFCQYIVKSSKEVICLNTNKIFKSIKKAQEKYCISHVSSCCQGKRKSAGKHPKTGEPLKWMYLEDYHNLLISKQDKTEEEIEFIEQYDKKYNTNHKTSYT